MSDRREARLLEREDQFQTAINVTWQVESAVEPSDDGTVQVTVRPVVCGPNCGSGCGCDSAILANCGPLSLTLKTTRRVTFLGNLGQLLKDAEALNARIARLQGAPHDPKDAASQTDRRVS